MFSARSSGRSRTSTPADGSDDTTVQVNLGAGGNWHLRQEDERWVLEAGVPERPAAAMSVEASMAWRLLTGLPVPDEAITMTGADDCSSRWRRWSPQPATRAP